MIGSALATGGYVLNKAAAREEKATKYLNLVRPVHDYFGSKSSVIKNYEYLMEAYTLTKFNDTKKEALEMAIIVEEGLNKLIQKEIDSYLSKDYRLPKDSSIMSETYKQTFGKYGRASDFNLKQI